jgi:TIR domain
MNAMHRAFLSGAPVVGLYSQAYFDSKYCVREATEALKGDPANEQQRLVPLRIEACAPAGMINITYSDLIAERPRERVHLRLAPDAIRPWTACRKCPALC